MSGEASRPRSNSVPTLATAITSNTAGDDDGGTTIKHSPGRGLDAELALKALDDALKRGVKQGHHGPEILAFIRGTAASAPLPSSPPKAIATAESGGPWGLPLLLQALDSALLSFSSRGRATGSGSSRDTVKVSEGDASVTAAGGAERPWVATLSLSLTALGSAVSVVRTCTQAAPPDEQEALLSSLLSQVLPPSPAAAASDSITPSNCGAGSSENNGIGGRIEQHAALLPALAAVMGAVDLDSRALGTEGTVAAAVPALLSAALAEGAEGLVDAEGGWRRGAGVGAPGGGEGTAGAAPCCQCLGAVLNKLTRGPELDSAVTLVVGALKTALSGGGGKNDGETMDVEGVGAEEGLGKMGPVQCLAWTMKAVAMRGGLGSVFSTLLDLLCGLLLVS